MANENNCTYEELMRECEYISDQLWKYRKLSKLFKSEWFGKLGRHFEQRYEMFSNMFNRFAKEHEDILWDIVLY